MGLSKLLGIGDTIKPIADLAGKFIEDKDKKNQYEQELAVLKLQAESEIIKTQKEVIVEALRNNTVPVKVFVYVFLSMMAFNFVIAVLVQFFPAIHYIEVMIPESLSTIILTIIGGIFGKEALLTSKDVISNNISKKKIDTIDNSKLMIKCLNDNLMYNTISEVAVTYNIKQNDILKVLEGKSNDVKGLIFIKTKE